MIWDSDIRMKLLDFIRVSDRRAIAESILKLVENDCITKMYLEKIGISINKEDLEKMKEEKWEEFIKICDSAIINIMTEIATSQEG